VREPENRQYDRAEDVLETGTDYRAIFCTEVGAIYVDLYENFTPVTVNNFVFLAERGYYNNTTFHRVLEDFMAQGGDPTGTGTGTPGYRFEDEFVGFLHFDRPGLLAMANSGQPVTNGSQFFITTSTPTYLNYRHTIFGEVLEGQDTVEELRLRDPQQSPSFQGTGLETVVIVDNPEAVTSNFEHQARASQSELNDRLEQDLEIPGLESFNVAQADPIEASDFAELNNFEFGVDVIHESETCDFSEAAFVETGFRLLAFATVEDATQAIGSAEMASLAVRDEATDYEQIDSTTLDHPYLLAETQACDTDTVHAIAYWQRGHYIIIADAMLIGEERSQADLWLQQVVGWRIYENLFTTILRKEIGQNAG
jgi:cyclophilin family peptidyl-prolyl cis-trans isomerase